MPECVGVAGPGGVVRVLGPFLLAELYVSIENSTFMQSECRVTSWYRRDPWWRRWVGLEMGCDLPANLDWDLVVGLSLSLSIFLAGRTRGRSDLAWVVKFACRFPPAMTAENLPMPARTKVTRHEGDKSTYSHAFNLLPLGDQFAAKSV